MAHNILLCDGYEICRRIKFDPTVNIGRSRQLSCMKHSLKYSGLDCRQGRRPDRHRHRFALGCRKRIPDGVRQTLEPWPRRSKEFMSSVLSPLKTETSSCDRWLPV